MRNLKRALSLAMASVMLLGMMVVGAGAKGYDDVKETDNVEAIEVLQAIEVMVGDERGFGPDRPVNRAEMAVVMGLLLNLDYNYYSATCPFNDVYDWARGWVGACAANGIVSGRGDGVYDPGATVTAVEGASMLMRALGYFKYPSDYADGFEVSTVRQGTTIGIFKGVGSSATEPMTRNQVAQMVLNALKSGMVQPDGNTLNYFDNNGNIIATGGKINYVYVTSNDSYAQAISDLTATSMGSYNNAPIVELGEQLYNGELKLYGESDRDRYGTTDVFGRPARIWEYKGKEIGTYVKKELLKESYTTKVTGQTLYDLLGKNTIDNYRDVITIDGEDSVDSKTILNNAGYWFDYTDLYRTNKDGVGGTGKGVLTEVFVDTNYKDKDDYTYYISIINTYLAKAAEDYDTKNKDVDLTVYNIDNKAASNAPTYVKDGDADETITVSMDDLDVENVKKDDLYLVRVAEGRVQEMVSPEIIDKASLNAFSQGDWINTNSTQYDYASTARYDVKVLDRYDNKNMKDLTYNVILDKYGYLIGIERNEDPDQYVFLTGIESGYSNLGNRNVDATVIHMDGTMQTVTVDTKKSDFDDGFTEPSQANTWCTYSVSNGVYTLERVAVAGATPVIDTDNGIEAAQHAYNVTGNEKVDIDTKHVTLYGNDSGSLRVYGNDKTVYINTELDQILVDQPNARPRRIIDDVTSVTTGIKNTKISVENVIDTDVKGNATDLPANDAGRYVAPVNEIYALYDDESYIIAAVTIGVDEGISSNWAYVTSNKVKSEAWNGDSADSRAAGDGKWTWSREAVVNGKITLLTEVGDTLQHLGTGRTDGNMQQGEWYEIKYDADGNVRRTEHLRAKLEAENAGFTDNIGNIQTAIADKNKDTVLLSDEVNIKGLTFNEQGTLYVQDDTTKGFAVSPDVITVLALADKKGKEFDSVTDTYTGYRGLKDAMRNLNSDLSKDTSKTLELSAIIVNGSATVIVINDKKEAPNQKPNGGFEPTPTGLTVTYGRTAYNSATFYLNGKVVSTSDLSYANGNYSFPVKEGDNVEIYGTTLFPNVGKAGTYTAADGTVYTATADKSSVTFKVGKTAIAVPAPADIKVAADAASAEFVKSVKVQLNDTDKTELTSSYSLNSSGDLVIEFKATEGMTITTGSAPTAKSVTSATADYSALTVGDVTAKTGTTDTYTATIAANQLSAALKADKVDIVLTVAADGYDINWVLPAGYLVVPGTGTTAAVSGTNSADLKLSFNGGMIGKIKTADIKIEFTGGATATYTKAGQNFNNTIALTDINNTASSGAKITATAPVTATVTITPKTVTYEDSTAASSKYVLDSTVIDGTPSVGTVTNLPLLKVSAKSGDTITNGAKAKLTFTITGVEGGPLTVTTEDAVVATKNAYTIAATDFKDDTLPSFKADGTGPVSIAITKVEVTSIKVSYTAAANNVGITAVAANGADVTDDSGTDIDVTGKTTITLVVTIGKNGTGTWTDGTFGVKVNNKVVDGSLTPLTADGSTITIEVPVDDLTTYAIDVASVS